jgi:hypothetical protein
MDKKRKHALKIDTNLPSILEEMPSILEKSTPVSISVESSAITSPKKDQINQEVKKDLKRRVKKAKLSENVEVFTPKKYLLVVLDSEKDEEDDTKQKDVKEKQIKKRGSTDGIDLWRKLSLEIAGSKGPVTKKHPLYAEVRKKYTDAREQLKFSSIPEIKLEGVETLI